MWQDVFPWLNQCFPSGVTLIKADQGGELPTRPFAVAKARVASREGHPFYGPLDDDGIQPVYQDALVTLSIDTYGPGAFNLADNAWSKMVTTTINDAMMERGFAFVETLSPPTDLSAVVGTTFEERAHLDVSLRTALKILDDVGLIERVEITGNVNDGAATYTDIVEV